MESLVETPSLTSSYVGAPVIREYLTLVEDAVITKANPALPRSDDGSADQSDDVEDMWDNVPI